MQEELTHEGLKLLQPSAAIRCLTAELSGAAKPRSLERLVRLIPVLLYRFSRQSRTSC